MSDQRWLWSIRLSAKEYYRLRKFHSTDAEALYEALKDEKVVRHMASTGITLQDCEKIIKEASEHWKKYQIGSWAVVNSVTDKIIGWAGFKRIAPSGIELLVVLSPSHWGIGTAITGDLIDKAKNKYRLNKIYVLLPETRKSFRFIKKLGFVYEGKAKYANEPFLKFVMVFDGSNSL